MAYFKPAQGLLIVLTKDVPRIHDGRSLEYAQPYRPGLGGLLFLQLHVAPLNPNPPFSGENDRRLIEVHNPPLNIHDQNIPFNDCDKQRRPIRISNLEFVKGFASFFAEGTKSWMLLPAPH